jgi:hypothetical protein
VEILTSLALLACPVGMGLMMWFMAKAMRRDEPRAGVGRTPSIEALHAERERVDAELDRLEGREVAAR